ncbi:MAG: V4R domain-containing protein, partial [Infirmifilum sp.]
YEGFIKGGYERFGSAFAVMLYLMGFEAGRKAFVDYYSVFHDFNTLQKVVTAAFQMLGYGVPEVVMVDDNAHRAVVRVYDSFECELFKGADNVRSGFIRGFIAGFLAGHWNVKRVFAREVKCIARGDPYCEFHVEVEEGSR